MTEHLPPGWCWATLGNLFRFITDGDHQPPPQSPSGIPFLVIGDVRDGRIDLSEARHVPQAYFDALGEHRKPARGDMLYTVTGSFGIPVYVDTDVPFCVQRHIAILKASPHTPTQYIAHALSTRAAFLQASAVATGTAQKTVGLKHLRTITIPVAPAGERNEIVGALASYLSRADEARTLLERVQRNLRRYRASVLKAAVEGRLVPTEAELARAESRTYEPASLLVKRALMERRQQWETGGRRGKYVEPESPDGRDLPELPEGWCWVSPRQMFEWSSGSFLPKKDQRGGTIPVYGGNGIAGFHDEATAINPTLVIGRVGAHCGNVHITEGPAWITDNAIYATSAPTGANLPFWRMALSVRDLNASAAGTGQPYVNQRHLNDLVIGLPPAAEQIRIEEEVGRLFSLVESSSKIASANVLRAQRLRQSILKWAFEGKLVDQDANDEPASALLARIKAEQPAPKSSSTHRRRAKQTA